MRWPLVCVLFELVLGACHAKEPSGTGAPPPRLIDAGADAAAIVDGGPVDAGETIASALDAGTLVVEPCAPAAADGGNNPNAAVKEQLTLTRTKFADLPAWADDKLSEAIPSFLNSCAVIAKKKDSDPMGVDGHGGLAKHWRSACDAAAKVPAGDDKAARAMFESEFVPWIAAGAKGPNGKMTGYNVQEIHASRKKDAKYKYPVYGKPGDLMMLDLGKFITDAHGRRIWVRVDAAKGELVPYYTRKEIRLGALAGKNLELMYASDPADLLFAHIEGSAKAVMDDGTTTWLEFTGKNGRAGAGVGGTLKSIGAFTRPGQGTMQGIHKWFDDNPKRFDEVVDLSASYVFFGEQKRAGAYGSQGVLLTAERSAAIDRSLIAHSTPIFIDTNAPIPGKRDDAPWRKLVIAQDTGGGINGAVRADIYWGDTLDAADRGGRMGGAGRFWLLLPKGVEK